MGKVLTYSPIAEITLQKILPVALLAGSFFWVYGVFSEPNLSMAFSLWSKSKARFAPACGTAMLQVTITTGYFSDFLQQTRFLIVFSGGYIHLRGIIL